MNKGELTKAVATAVGISQAEAGKAVDAVFDTIASSVKSREQVAIAGFGGVGRATANLLLQRRDHYRQIYGVDVRLVAVCGSRAGLAYANGLQAHQLDDLQPGLSGPDFVAASGAEVLIEAGPSDFRSGGPGLDYLCAALSAGRDCIVIAKGALVHSGPRLRELVQPVGHHACFSPAPHARNCAPANFSNCLPIVFFRISDDPPAISYALASRRRTHQISSRISSTNAKTGMRMDDARSIPRFTPRPTTSAAAPIKRPR